MSGLTRNQLTSESKAVLRKTVRGLRASLIAQLKEAAEQRYRLLVPVAKAQLGAEALELRRRLEAALDQAAAEEGGGKEARARAFEAAAKEAGATLLNRLVLIRHLEALGLSKPAVLTGGWMSKGYQEFQSVAGALCADETQGMAPLLELLFGELAVALPGLFGDVGLTRLFPVLPATLREVIEALDAVPAGAWSDDLTLGWVYQFWNDPDREALDAKINASGKIEPHEIASKTQMFTERYMVEWLLQNSLGATWLAVCKKNKWTPEAEASGVLADLDKRRAEWRKKREAGEVALDALMPISGVLEESWKYYVPQPMPAAVVEHAPTSVRELKLLDPACGSGHFLVVAFDLLVELYREEARHRQARWTDREIAEWILEDNLHGIDIDPRAVQLAAAGLYLKARALAKDAEPRQVNLVAPMLKLSALDEGDATLVKLERDIEEETGIPPALTRELIETLAGVDHLGSLLKVGDAIDKALAAHEGAFAQRSGQRDLFNPTARPGDVQPLSREAARKIVLQRLEGFLGRHSGAEDLGLRLRGQQLSAGLRFASVAKEGEYHVVVGNPPYQGTSKMKDAKYIAKHYPRGKSDLYAAFLERGLEFCRPGGASAMVTMRSWMFLSGFTALREHLLKTFDLRIIGDVDRGAFEEVPDEVVATTMSVFRRTSPAESAVALQPTELSDRSRDSARTARKRAALLVHRGRHGFRCAALSQVSTSPLIYWWSEEDLRAYSVAKKLAEVAPTRQGAATSDNRRFVRKAWEVRGTEIFKSRHAEEMPVREVVRNPWVPFIQGAQGRQWIEPLYEVVAWRSVGLELRSFAQHLYGSYSRTIKNEAWYFKSGVAFSPIGNSFAAREHRYRSVFGHMGSSVFPVSGEEVLCLLNMQHTREVLSALNPGLHFEVGDVNRLPVRAVRMAREVVRVLRDEFARFESGRESSCEFSAPCAHDWQGAQAWAQRVVDASADLPLFVPNRAVVPREAELSYRVGLAMGRGSGSRGLGDSVLFVSAFGESDSLALPCCRPLIEFWGLSSEASLRDWLRVEFWAYHRDVFENRPVFLPLSSAKRSFVAFVAIHDWSPMRLTYLLSEYLVPKRKALEGAIADLRASRASGEKKGRGESERQLNQHQKWLEELEDFIAKVTQIAEKGPPPPDASTPAREVDAPYVMDLDDGVMVNAAALWPLLEPMWKDPKKWWKELATAKGRKDYDWSHLAARYFPDRVDEKCKKDPSLGVAHGCFWKYHPEVAYQWELRLQDEIGPDFRIDEKDSDTLRAKFLKDHAERAAELEAAEQVRRQRKAAKQDQDELELDDAEAAEDAGEDA